MRRRDLLKLFPAGAAVGFGPVFAGQEAGQEKPAAERAEKPRGLPPLKITDIKTILTAPDRVPLVVVKILTNEPGLYGLGCATFTQRALVVRTAIDKYLKPFLIGRNPDEIEDIWQSSYVSSYWRNGPVLFNAMSGVDMALWDIKGKRAGMPLYQLLGGKCRFAAPCYVHTQGRDMKEVEDAVRAALEKGYKHVRIQLGIPGMATYGTKVETDAAKTPAAPIGPTNLGPTWETGKYLREVPKLFEHLRVKIGEEVELLHDVHERVSPNEGVKLCKDLEQYHPFFIEDPLPPEQNDHFRLIRQQCATPIAMGELFNTQHEYVPLITNRLIDFIRIHISQIGGLSVARKVATLAEFFGVRTAWHGPPDVSPVGHAAGLALELASYNFGVHERGEFSENSRTVFPGCPEFKEGFLYANEAPGLGIDIDEALADKFPVSETANSDLRWGTMRRRDGTVIRP